MSQGAWPWQRKSTREPETEHKGQHSEVGNTEAQDKVTHSASFSIRLSVPFCHFNREKFTKEFKSLTHLLHVKHVLEPLFWVHTLNHR